MIVGCLRNTRIKTREKTGVLENVTHKFHQANETHDSVVFVFCCCLLSKFLWLSSIQVKSKSAQSPIAKKTERPTKDMPAHKLKNNNLYTWETSRTNRGSLCPAWRSDLFVRASRALLCVQIRSDPPRKAGERRK